MKTNSKTLKTKVSAASKISGGGIFYNTGDGYNLQIIDIQHPNYAAVIQPDTAFWCLVNKNEIGNILCDKSFKDKIDSHNKTMQKEMDLLRFHLKPSAVYFNPTDLCNLNCGYCYIPEVKRKNGENMSLVKLNKAMDILKEYFQTNMSGYRKPQIVFHGSEPMMNKENVFKTIENYENYFDFGIQTNGTLLEKNDIEFIKSHNITIGLSIDGHIAAVNDSTRKKWNNIGVYKKVIALLNLLQDYSFLNVICTVTKSNINYLTKIVDFFYDHNIQYCLINQVHCTLDGGRKSKPADLLMAQKFIESLERTRELYHKTGRKIIVANFANILLSIVAPSARRLMCDINPCGGGRCFFAVAANGDMFPCSEFIGLPKFCGGNIFTNKIENVLNSNPFKMVTERFIEQIVPCNTCAIRHFCGAPCPAEAFEINYTMQSKGAFCEFYEHQVRFAFRVIADRIENDYLWDNWDKDTAEVFTL